MSIFTNPLDYAQLQGIPGLTPQVVAVANMVREYMRDFPELNRLIAGYETSDRQLIFAVMDAISYMNLSPPMTRMSVAEWMTIDAFPLVRYFTVITLLEGIGLLQTRNHISYSNGGKTVGVNDKTPLIRSWLEYFRAVADQLLKQVKTSLNIMSIMGPDQFGNASEYFSLHSTYATW